MASMKFTPDSTVSLVSVFIFLTAAFFPTGVLHDFVDSIIGRAILLLFVLYAIRIGGMAGVLAILAVTALFVERNRYQIFQAKTYIVGRGSTPTLGHMAPESKPANVHGPVKDELWVGDGEAMEDTESWHELPSGESEDHKEVIESQLFPNSKIDEFYVSHGLAPKNALADS
jgi:hypothetical protein